VEEDFPHVELTELLDNLKLDVPKVGDDDDDDEEDESAKVRFDLPASAAAEEQKMN